MFRVLYIFNPNGHDVLFDTVEHLLSNIFAYLVLQLLGTIYVLVDKSTNTQPSPSRIFGDVTSTGSFLLVQ